MEGDMLKILRFLSYNWGITIIGAMTIIQIAPIKINPWGWVAKNIRKLIYGDIEKELSDMKTRIGEMDDRITGLANDVIGDQVSNQRWNILAFANSCRRNDPHAKEEWDHCMDELKKYEDYCERKSIPNGKMEEAAKYLRKLYHEKLTSNDFLV